MKKSVKSLLLALMVLCLSATAGFAVSYDVKIELGKGTMTKIDPTAWELKSTDLKSFDISEVELASFDTGKPLVSASHVLSVDFSAKTASFSVKEVTFTLDAASFKSADVKVLRVEDATKALKGAKDITATSNDIVVSYDVDSFDILFTFTKGSTDVKGGASIARLHVAVSCDYTADSTTALDKEVITVFVDGVSEDIAEDNPFIVTSKSETAELSGTVEVTEGANLSFEIKPGDSLVTVSADGKALTSEDNYYVLKEVTEETTVVFSFASSDEGKTVDFTLTVTLGGDDEEETTKLDIGTIDFTLNNTALDSLASASITTAMVSDEANYTTSTVASVTAAKTLTPSAAASTAEFGFSYENDKISSYKVYSATSSTATPTSLDVTETTQGTVSFTVNDGYTYYIVYTAVDAVDAGDSIVVKVTYTDSSSSSETITDDQAEELASADVAKNIATTVASTKVSASDLRSNNRTVYNSLLSSLGLGSLTDEEVTRRVVFMTITGKIKKGQLFGVNLVPVASSTVTTPDNDDYDDMLSASDNAAADFENYFAIDTQSNTLIDVDTNLIVKNELESGYYVVLVTLFGGYKGSSVAVAATGDAYLNGGNNYLSTETITGSNNGSSSGCDAGFGALALLAIVPFIKKIRK